MKKVDLCNLLVELLTAVMFFEHRQLKIQDQ